MSATVVLPHFQAQAELERTLAGLRHQTYPPSLTEIIVVDDGSPDLPDLPDDLDGRPLRLLSQERRGRGQPRAQNLGAANASGELVVFLDADMIPEPHWLEAHARWHHLVEDAVTLGVRRHVDPEGVTPAAVGKEAARGAVSELFRDRVQEYPQWIERRFRRNNWLTIEGEDLFGVVTSGNVGMRHLTFKAIGGFDESFTQWGGEDTELGFRAYTYGALLIPDRAALCWHQGLGQGPDPVEARSQKEQRQKLAHLVAHPSFRRWAPGRSYTVPYAVVRVAVGNSPMEDVVSTVESILGSGFHDLIVWLSVPDHHPDRELLMRSFEPDPRVRVGPPGGDLTEVPWASIRVDVPVGAIIPADLLENAVVPALRRVGMVRLRSGDHTIVGFTTRAWGRANRTDPATDLLALMADLFGKEEDEPGATTAVGVESASLRSRLRRAVLARLPEPVRARLRSIKRRLRSSSTSSRKRAKKRKPNTHPAIASVRQRGFFPARSASRWLTIGYGSRGLVGSPFEEYVNADSAVDDVRRKPWDVLVIDDSAVDERRPELVSTITEVATDNVVVAVEPLAPSLVPAVTEWPTQLTDLRRLRPIDPEIHRPVGFRTDTDDVYGAFIPRWSPNWRRQLPEGVSSSTSIDVFSSTGDELDGGSFPAPLADETSMTALRRYRAILDMPHFHHSDLGRASLLVRLSAAGIPTVATDTGDLEELIGSNLAQLLGNVHIEELADPRARELVSVRARRIVWNEHTPEARVRRLLAALGLPVPNRPAVSVLACTQRPDQLDHLITQVSIQKYRPLELVLVLHGEGFADKSVAEAVAGLEFEHTVLRVPHSIRFGSALNQGLDVAGGDLVTKMDDDDWYDPNHIGDLVTAWRFSGADLVGKAAEFVYLSNFNETVRRFAHRGERFSQTLGGGGLLMAKEDLNQVGGWADVAREVDRLLINHVVDVGGHTYRTHGFGYVLNRHGTGHTWGVDDAHFREMAIETRPGLALDFAGFAVKEEAG